MKRIVLLIMLLPFFCGNAAAQGKNYVDSLMSTLTGTIGDTATVNILNKLAEESQYVDYNKFLEYGEKALDISTNLGYKKGIAEAHNNIGTYYRLKGIYNESIDYYFNALEIMEEIKDKKGIARSFNLIGILYYSLENFELSLEYYTKALEMNIEQNDRKWIAGNSNNIGMIYERMNEKEKAIEYYMKSLEMNLELGNKNWIANNYGNIGSLYLLQGKAESLEYFIKRLKIKEEQKDTSGIAISLDLVGNYYLETGNPGDAVPHLLKAHEYATQVNSLSIKDRSSQKLSQAYAQLSDYQSALNFAKLNKLYDDSLKLSANTEKITRLQMQYSNKKDQEISELNYAKSKMIQTAVATVLVFILLFILLIYNRQRISAKASMLMQSKLELGNRLLQEELDFKEKMLQENINYLLDINELLTSTITRFNSLITSSKPENKQVIKEIISDLQSGINDDIWKEFEVRFNQIHKNFYKKINTLFPDLTPNEKKLCAFLKLKMTSKEISAITSLSVKSIETARSRLRKKLNIENKSKSLSDFFENL